PSYERAHRISEDVSDLPCHGALVGDEKERPRLSQSEIGDELAVLRLLLAQRPCGLLQVFKGVQRPVQRQEQIQEKDNFECAACHDENPQPVTVGGIQFAKGIKERAPGHKECFVCHFNEQEVDKKSKTFATNCIGCHNLEKKDKGMG